MSKVKIVGNASGSGTLTLTGPDTNSDRTITLPDSTGTVLTLAGGAMTGSLTNFTSTGIDDNADATAITIDSSENVGIGVTPESWHSVYSALQIGGTGVLFSNTAVGTGKSMYITQNAYNDGSWKYQTTDEAARYQSVNGTHKFSVAASGSADAAITFSDAMIIDNSGYITKPLQPVATASWSGSVSGSTTQIPASTIYVNIGSHLAASGRFTAPVAGTYWYSFTGMSSSAGNHLSIRLYKNNTGMSNDLTAYTDDETYAHTTSFGYITLAANDYLEFRNMLTTLHTSYGTINFALVA